MAEDQDQSQKTEEPSQRRLEEARRQGQVASSREVNHALVLASGALFIGVLAPGVAVRLARSAAATSSSGPTRSRSTPPTWRRRCTGCSGRSAGSCCRRCCCSSARRSASGLIQHGPVWSAAPLAPKLERISPSAGAKRLFSLRSLVEFAKGLVKIVLVGAAAARSVVAGRAAHRSPRSGSRPGRCLRCCTTLALRLLIGVARWPR